MPNKRRLRPPEFALSDFYPADCVLNPRGSSRNPCGVIADVLAADFATGAALSINGTLPVICSSAVCSDRALRLFEVAGMPEVAHTITYDRKSDYDAILADCRQQQKPVIFQHPPSPGDYPRELYWIDPDLFGRLNHAAYLAEFVPPPNLPERTVLRASELPAYLNSSSKRPVVLKGANLSGRESRAVAIIDSSQAIETLCDRLEADDLVVAEEFLSIADNYRVNFAADGHEIFLLGYCDPIANRTGEWAGNWISLVRHPPHEVIEAGLEIMRRATLEGYVGVAGFDIVRDRRGRILVIELNFRLSESAPAVMWQNRLLSRKGAKCVGRVIVWSFHDSADPEFSLLHELVDSDWFFPLTIYDPQASPYGFDEVRVTGILFGSSRYQVEQRLQKLYRKFGVTKEDSGSIRRAA